MIEIAGYAYNTQKMLLLIILPVIIRKKTSHKLGLSICKILLGSRWLPNSFK